jgi:hypothetical protein
MGFNSWVKIVEDPVEVWILGVRKGLVTVDDISYKQHLEVPMVKGLKVRISNPLLCRICSIDLTKSLSYSPLSLLALYC